MPGSFGVSNLGAGTQSAWQASTRPREPCGSPDAQNGPLASQSGRRQHRAELSLSLWRCCCYEEAYRPWQSAKRPYFALSGRGRTTVTALSGRASKVSRSRASTYRLTAHGRSGVTAVRGPLRTPVPRCWSTTIS